MPGYEFCPWCQQQFDDCDGRYETSRMTKWCQSCESGIERYHAYCPACGEAQTAPKEKGLEPCDCDWPIDREIYLYCPWCSIEL